jgi:hypothetical protein
MNLVYDPCMPSDVCLTGEGTAVVIGGCIIAMIVILIIARYCAGDFHE